MRDHSALAVLVDPHEIGKYSYIGEFTHISQNVSIGKYCSIGNLCTIGAQHHSIDGLTTWPMSQSKKNKPTSIRNDVWIGCNSVVLAGLKVGDGAVIGAGSVVTKDVPPYGVVYGNPARLVRFRFDAQTIDELLKSRWWDLPHENLRQISSLEISECVKALKKARNGS